MNVKVTKDELKKVLRSIQQLAAQQVLVGIPATTTERKGAEPINNATIGYIQEAGSPANNLPARPFLVPGVQDALPGATEQLKKGAQAALGGNMDGADKRVHAAGIVAQNAVRARINEGVPPPLAEATLEARARRGRKGAQEELDRRAEGKPAGVDLAKPLIDTGQLRNSITYVIRKK